MDLLPKRAKAKHSLAVGDFSPPTRDSETGNSRVVFAPHPNAVSVHEPARESANCHCSSQVKLKANMGQIQQCHYKKLVEVARVASGHGGPQGVNATGNRVDTSNIGRQMEGRGARCIFWPPMPPRNVVMVLISVAEVQETLNGIPSSRQGREGAIGSEEWRVGGGRRKRRIVYAANRGRTDKPAQPNRATRDGGEISKTLSGISLTETVGVWLSCRIPKICAVTGPPLHEQTLYWPTHEPSPPMQKYFDGAPALPSLARYASGCGHGIL
ncbi:hypothetical protein DFH09DRAFT_1276597 [Mycena vulgaris]|nr:hypothetical protein DFH09DRAFT_1276597 [Mycena vulgaris]